MKTNAIPQLIAPLAAMALLSSTGSAQTRIPAQPTGYLSAYPTMVQTGTHPTLSWGSILPMNITDAATITPPGTITLTSQMYVTVSIIGSNASGTSTTTLPTDARMSVNGGSYTQLFYGNQNVVNPSSPLYIKRLDPGTTINFGGRYDQNNSWSSFVTSNGSTSRVITLVNGQSIPTNSPILSKPNIGEFIKPYLDTSGKIKIGPLSAIVLMELDTTDPRSSKFDYTDQVLLVSLSKTRGNNGHGNNIDGVDSSNPGKGSGGPNGGVDPSGTIDDER